MRFDITALCREEDVMISFAMLSDLGSRENNEDCIGMYQDEQKFCFALADGLGGHGYGEIASRTVIDTVIETFVSDSDEQNFLMKAFQAAQEKLQNKQRLNSSLADMKTTLVSLILDDRTAQWAHVGDSRLYCFVNGKLWKRTLDHSVPQMLVSSGRIREKDIRRHPDRNCLLRVMGEDLDNEELNVTLSEVCRRELGQAYLLCSDGFWELIEEKKMEVFLRKAKTPEEWLLLMQRKIIKNGHHKDIDNYSAIAVWDM